MPKNDENSLLSQLDTIAKGLSETFSPFCEVVVHDLKDPEHAIMSIHNNLSGREAGQPATELGLARIASPDFPEIIANYGNQFADGRPVKSTSIGIKDEEGNYVAALCLNVDMTLFRGCRARWRVLPKQRVHRCVNILTPGVLKSFASESMISPRNAPPRHARLKRKTERF